ncbi:MAG: PIN domain-containing protein [Solirubrobacterales bacterium]|nr:PIN domain-containing protein [Solirubrobacterales bacterium]
MAAILVDTTVVIDILRGRPGAAQRLARVREQGDLACVCAITVEETVRGLWPRERETAARLFGGLHIVPLSSREGRLAGEWRRSHAPRGRTLTQADCLVAAAALTAGGRLATGNPKDFPMRELRVEHWPTGQ